MTTTMVISVSRDKWECSINVPTECDGGLQAVELANPIVVTAGPGGPILQRVIRIFMCDRHLIDAKEKGVAKP